MIDGFKIDYTQFMYEKVHQKTFDLWKKTGEWETFMNYTVDELEQFRNRLNDTYLDELIEKCEAGLLKV